MHDVCCNTSGNLTLKLKLQTPLPELAKKINIGNIDHKNLELIPKNQPT